MKILEEIILFQNPDPLLVSKQGIFPGITKLSNNELIALFTIGQAFDSADQRTFISRSIDKARTWSKPIRLHNHIYSENQESESLKPLSLNNNNLIAVGYAFVRPDDLTPIVNPDTFEILPLNNKISFSSDMGRSWSVPKNFNVNNTPLEISGPCIQLKSGRIIGAAPPFHLKKMVTLDGLYLVMMKEKTGINCQNFTPLMMVVFQHGNVDCVKLEIIE